MSCNQIEQLFATTQHQIDTEDIEPIRLHLASGCAACRAQLNQLKKVLLAIDTPAWVAPPEQLTHPAMNAFRGKALESPLQSWKRIPAFLLIDSTANGHLTGFRSNGMVPRQMLYQAGDYNINLSLSSLSSTLTVDIMGQPTAQSGNLAALAGANVTLLKNAQVVCPTKSNEFGAFILSSVPEGIYDLKIRLVDEELDIVGLNVTVHPQA